MDSLIAQGENQTVSRGCTGCNKVVLPGQKGKPSHFMCNFCLNWYCLPCAEISKKPEIVFAERDDIFWGCKVCISKFKTNTGSPVKLEVVPATGGIHDHSKNPIDILDKLEEMRSQIVEKIDILETNIVQSSKSSLDEGLKNLHTQVSNVVKNDINDNVVKAWSTTLFGDSDSPDPDSGEWKTVVNGKKKNKTLPQVTK